MKKVLVRSLVKLALLLSSLLTACISLSTKVYAGPWIEVGDARTRHHLQYLVDTGAIGLPATTWPLPWASVKQALDEIDPRMLTADQNWSINYLNHAINLAMVSASVASHSHVSKNPEIFNHFGSENREAEELGLSISLLNDGFAFRLAGSYADEPSDNNHWRADGSYLAAAIGSWTIGVGAVDQWWGPGHQSSLILSNNARPAPGIFIKRTTADAFNTPVLSWLGQWQFMTFMSRLNNGADNDSLGIQTPLLWGTRLNFVPLRGLEIGLSRTALWGGEDQEQDLSHFKKIVFNDDSKEISQLLNSLDVRYGRSVGRATVAVYSQLALQENLDAINDQDVALAGIEIAGLLGGIHNRITLEASNSIEGLTGNNHQYNNTYEHTHYKQGYRYHQRNIGISSDGNSKTLTLAGQHYFDNGHRLTWRWIHAEFNTTPPAPANLSVLGNPPSQVDNTQLQYRLPISEQVMMEVGISIFDHAITVDQDSVDSSLELSFFHIW